MQLELFLAGVPPVVARLRGWNSLGWTSPGITSVRSVLKTVCPDDDAYLQVPVRRERFPCLYSLHRSRGTPPPRPLQPPWSTFQRPRAM